MKVICHMGVLSLKVSIQLCIDEFGVTPTLYVFDSHFFSNLRLAKKASYSTWLFVVLNSNWRDYYRIIPYRPSKITPAPPPFVFNDPFTCNFQHNDFSFVVVFNLATKSTSHWAFIDPLGSYLIPNSDSLINQAIIRSTSFGFFNIVHILWLVWTTI